jgi:hypothetical protein
MASESVSFRITRHTQDLAETIHALSQRLVNLEQRLGVVELQLARAGEEDSSELASLDQVDRLLDDCRQLLDLPAPQQPEKRSGGG